MKYEKKKVIGRACIYTPTTTSPNLENSVLHIHQKALEL